MAIIMNPSPELVTNGGFDTDSDWSKETGWTISGGTASQSGGNALSSLYKITSAIVPGRPYSATFTVVSITSGQVRIELGGGQSARGTWRTTTGTHTEILTATETSYAIKSGDTGNEFAGTIDNVSLKEVKVICKPSPELITNGGFDTDTDWTKSGGWSISDGVASCDGTAGDLRQFPTLTPGNTYRLTYEITARTAGSIRARVGGTNNASDNSTLGFKTEDFVAGSTANRIDIRPVDFNGSIDNVSLKEVKALIK